MITVIMPTSPDTSTSQTSISRTLIKTRFLVLSDTHGRKFSSEGHPHHNADVAIHCGDLTEESKIAEFRASLELLKSIDAPLKLVIAGNHDFTLDIPMFKKKVAEARPPLRQDEVTKEYGDFGEVRAMFREAEDADIRFLDEGTHRFILENGAALIVYASPYTPSLSDWGFQYHPQEGHEFSIETGTDVAMTHCPPRGVLDLTYSRKRAGSAELFAAVARTRPVLHCYGHIHEAWGAKLVTWRENVSNTPSHFSDIDNDKSVLIGDLKRLNPSKLDDDEAVQAKAKKVEAYAKDRCFRTSHCTRDEHPLERGRQTLFVNASIEGDEKQPMQLPWLVDLELRPASDVPPHQSPSASQKRKQSEGDEGPAEAESKRRKADP